MLDVLADLGIMVLLVLVSLGGYAVLSRALTAVAAGLGRLGRRLLWRRGGREMVSPRVCDAPADDELRALLLSYATVEWLPNSRVWYGEIPGLPGVSAIGATEGAARAALRDVLDNRLAVHTAHDAWLLDGVRGLLEKA